MKTCIEIELKPFTVPNFAVSANNLVARQEGCESQTFPLQFLTSETLERMCDEFREAVFEKAGKPRPPQDVALCGKCSHPL